LKLRMATSMSARVMTELMPRMAAVTALVFLDLEAAKISRAGKALEAIKIRHRKQAQNRRNPVVRTVTQVQLQPMFIS